MAEISKFIGNIHNTTLAQAIKWLEEHMDDGAECPCCGQLAKVYKRKLNSAMAFVLLLLHRRKGDDWVHVPSYINEKVRNPAVAAAVRGDWAKLVHWGLLSALEAERPDGSKRVGYYKVTKRGHRFAHNQIEVPKHLWFYNGGSTDRVDGKRVSIVEALGDKFNYSELMNAK